MIPSTPNQRVIFRNCNINQTGWLRTNDGKPVMLDVASATVASFQIVKTAGTWATAALSTYLANDPHAEHLAGTSIAAPAADPRIKHTGAIDVTGYASIGLQVTTAEGAAGTVDVFALIKQTNS